MAKAKTFREKLADQKDFPRVEPISTGILARVAAGAAGEDEADGRKRVTPYWRTLKSGGEVNPKYPGGVEGQRDRLIAEGHRVDVRGHRAFVVDYERHLVTLGTNG